jgi:streptomycin 6-kinase
VTITIPPQLARAVDEDNDPERRQWLAALPRVVETVVTSWELELGEPYLPGGQCAWVAPAHNPAAGELVLKVGWRHPEAEHEADALRFWDGNGAVRCLATQSLDDTIALLIERCTPGHPLDGSLPEREQDPIIARLLRRLWSRQPEEEHPFNSLHHMCTQWADAFELDYASDNRGLDPGLARDGIGTLRELPDTAGSSVLLCTDLHAGNILAARREPWLVVDPKPFVGDPAYDPVQHMLNCDERLAADPVGLARGMADLLDLDRERVKQWLFARCVHESLHDVSMRAPARRLAP